MFIRIQESGEVVAPDRQNKDSISTGASDSVIVHIWVCGSHVASRK